MADRRNPHVEDLAGAYALGALESEERLRVDAHVEGCAACAEAVEGARGVTRLLPYAVDAREPPADLESRLMARVTSGPRRLPESPPPPPRRLRPFDSVSRTSARRGPIRTAALRLFPIAAAAMLMLGLGGWNVRLQGEVARQQQISALLAQAETRELVADAAGGGGHGRAYVDPATGQVLIAVSRLPGLPTGREYQLWFVRPDGGRDSGGTFRVDDGGNGVLLASAPRGLGAYTGLGVTTEPMGGSSAPTTARVVGGTL